MKFAEAAVKILVRLGVILPNRVFIEEACRKIVNENREVFDELAKK